MPITYAVDKKQRLVHVTWTGEIRSKDVADYFRRAYTDREALAAGRAIIDVRGATLAVTSAELGILIESIARPLVRGELWKVAVVVHRVDQFKVFAETICQGAIFYDFEAAVRWVGR